MNKPNFFSFFCWLLLIGVLSGCAARLSFVSTGNINTAILCFYFFFIPLAIWVGVIYDTKNELYKIKDNEELNQCK